MKNITTKMLAVLFSIILILSFCSCKAKDKIISTSSTPVATKNSRTLLRATTASDDLDNIESIKILLDSCATGAPIITDKKDMAFLQSYTYSHYRSDKRENWDQWLKDNSVLCLNVVTKTYGESSLYLMQDGSIAIAQMCGDSEVPDISYDFYTTDKDDMLTKENLEKF